MDNFIEPANKLVAAKLDCVKSIKSLILDPGIGLALDYKNGQNILVEGGKDLSIIDPPPNNDIANNRNFNHLAGGI